MGQPSGVHCEMEDSLPTKPERKYAELAALVREARASRRLSQRQLSHALGKSEGYVGHLERGSFRPSAETLKALSAALGLLYGELAIRAGYITQAEFENPIDGAQLARLNEIGDLTEEEWESVRDFARYVRSRRPGA